MELTLDREQKQFWVSVNPKNMHFNNFGIGNCLKFEDLVPNVLQSYVVHKFICGKCTSVYIGETYRHLLTHIA